ncbi:carboxypeptidase-like regulatory domain-containing protein [Rubrivivax albus]|uniref:Carboxypeptidase regulatory-like domain-containing protein n=1 Tax=Rubrivivax albus TaxID=2499835 RepID=A0A3S2TZ96_9BURK|nr:carboxypeptidase-like regulatory domain-containing protein [Rubrivivax albus]RVT48092.1 carboxypeptidase regulatory-like domain-containing protein [Rubrivivax albus]
MSPSMHRPATARPASPARSTARAWWRAARTFGLSLAMAGAALGLVACGGGDDDGGVTGGGTPAPTALITGLAAVGAPIAGATVTGTNAQGQTVTAITASDGSFTLTITEGAPYALQVTDADGNVWASYAQAAGRANITPLTTLAMADAWGYRPLADLLANWQANAPTPEQVLAAAARVNANLQDVMRAQGVDPTALNVFTAEFAANGQGLDAVLDAMRLRFDCTATACTQTITSPDGNVLVTWNANISTTGFTVSWSGGGSGGGQIDVSLGACTANPVAGTWSMVVQTTVSGLGGVPIPEICIDGLPAKPASESEFCGGTDTLGALPTGVEVVSCSFDGTVGTIAARITSPITIDYSVTYTFVQR